MTSQAPACTNPAHRNLHLAPVPCPDCRGWLDRDGTVLSTRTMVTRYPHMISLVAQTPKPHLPDYAPSRWEAAGVMVDVAGKLAWRLILLLISGVVLAGLILFLAHV